MKLKKFLAVALTFVIGLSGISFGKAETKINAAVGDWNLVWSDEFNGTSLDTNTWNYETGTGNWGWGNNEQQYYTSRTQNVEVSGGTLKIKALKESYGGKSYTSGRITTQGKKDFKYGRIEARMKLPSFTGSWPAFWMLGANYSSVGWPKCGELDIMEAINTENFTNGALHWYVDSSGSQGDTGDSAEGKTPSGYVRTDWHTYGVEWDSQEIKWYIDDVVFLTQDITASHMNEFRKNQYIIFNLAIGGQWPGYTIDDSAFPSNSVMEVDYVRVYQKEEETTTEYNGPTITVTEDSVQQYTGMWVPFFSSSADWTATSGTLTTESTPSDGFTSTITSIGRIVNDSVWGVQSSLENIKYYPGNTYKYKCTITSDKDKRIFVKVAGSDAELLGGGYVDLKAGQPYYYENDVEIPEDYEGVVDLKFGFGKTDGDSIADYGAVTINVKDISFVTTATIPDPDYVPATSAAGVETTTISTQGGANVETTAKNPASTGDATPDKTTAAKAATRPGTPKIKKIIRKKKSLKIKLKKVKKADGYQIRYSTNKKFKKYKNKRTRYLNTTIRKLRSKKRYYIKVRSYYLNDNGVRVYSKFSKVKRVKTK